jgi:hypothetical protein
MVDLTTRRLRAKADAQRQQDPEGEESDYATVVRCSFVLHSSIPPKDGIAETSWLVGLVEDWLRAARESGDVTTQVSCIDSFRIVEVKAE